MGHWWAVFILSYLKYNSNLFSGQKRIFYSKIMPKLRVINNFVNNFVKKVVKSGQNLLHLIKITFIIYVC